MIRGLRKLKMKKMIPGLPLPHANERKKEYQPTGPFCSAVVKKKPQNVLELVNSARCSGFHGE
jgi:hypothetical protein